MNVAQRVYQVYEEYTETFCSPNSDVWEKRERILITTLDEQKARNLFQEKNEGKTWFDNRVLFRSFELS